MADSRKALIERLFAAHGGALQAFFRRRIRSKPEARDLTQEVYLRMLRVSDAEVIRNPEGYLYAVASNLVKEHAVLEWRWGRGLEVSDVERGDAELARQLAELPAFEEQIDFELRAVRLREVLMQLSPKRRAALVLQYQRGMSYEEIGKELGVSVHMVKKYLAQALALCRKRMARLG
jgi:RNA polymerase sigma factor (sigma-70 family)